MPDTTARLGLPVIAPSQAQKHVTHNEALRLLDGITQLVLEEEGLNTPPAVPGNGALYGLGPAPTGAWAGRSGQLAQWQNDQWLFLTPQEGWRAWNRAGNTLMIYQGGAWGPLSEMLQNLEGVGIGASSDATNRLAVASEATLLTHAGAGHQLKLNKSGAGDTVSLLYQSNWAGHAEMGLTGDNDFHLKVSADGNTWTEALVVDAADGKVSGAGVQADATDTAEGKLVTTEGAHAAALNHFGAYYNASAGQNIDLVEPGFVGLLHDGNAGTWPRPPFGAFVWIDTQRIYSVDAVRQRALYGYRSSGAPTYLYRYTRLRANTGGEWGPWVQEYNSQSIVGAVSQAAGLPTGSVIERGTNANGDYVRLADGTQICWCEKSSTDSQNIASGALYRTEGETVVFPASFAAGAAVQVNPGQSGTAEAWFTAEDPTVSSVQMYRMGTDNTATNVTYRCMALGRWF